MSEAPTLVIDGQALPSLALLSFQVVYDEIAARSTMRRANGAADRWQSYGGKVKATITAEGWTPLGLVAADLVSPVLVGMPSPRAVRGPSSVITMPAARRNGGIYDPVGFAEVAGELVSTPVALAGDVATLDVVAGAAGYRVQYFPEYLALLSISSETLDSMSGVYQWTLIAEEA